MSNTPALPIQDTPRVYGLVTRALHWSIAALILWQFFAMAVKVITGKNAVTAFLVGTHGSVGALIFVLVVLRLIWTIMSAGKRPDMERGPMRTAVKAGHGILYLLMLIVPLLAIVRAWGSTRGFAPFGIEVFSPREIDIAWTQNGIHGVLAWVFGLVVLGHIVMAIYHAVVLRDGVLSRMAGKRALRD